MLDTAHLDQASLEGGVALARESVRVELGFRRPDQDSLGCVLPLAQSVNNGKDWALDIQRLWQPEHPATRLLLERFKKLEKAVWDAQPEGGVWDQQIHGRNWLRYQIIAASSIQSARSQLEIHALTTLQRIRLFTMLKESLKQSVERVATLLLQLVGPAEGAGSYASVLDERD